VALNDHRTRAGLAPVDDVRSHIFTERPWLAADSALSPWPAPSDEAVFQTGAWMLQDERPLAPELERFLDAGDPPVYVGFGSVRAPEGVTAKLISAARALGRRVVILRGWADLSSPDDRGDCMAIGEVNQQTLFRRVAVAAHHGGAGTTTAAALSAAPQIVMAQHYDQPYWAARVAELGVGVALSGSPTVEDLATALEAALSPRTNAAAQLLAGSIRRDGVDRAAKAIAA
jgi:vancomycin aglycone glucosyltransferase